MSSCCRQARSNPRCATWEIAETDRLSKRLLPVLIKPLGATPVPERFQELNYIFFYPEPKVPGSGFGKGLTALVQALNTDLEWVREHTRLGQRAAEWQAGGQSENRLLSGDDIAAARAWLARRPPKAPEPTELHREFIRASEDAQLKRESAERQRLEEMAAAQAAREKASPMPSVRRTSARPHWAGFGAAPFSGPRARSSSPLLPHLWPSAGADAVRETAGKSGASG